MLSLTDFDKSYTVGAIESRQFERREIETGLSDGIHIEILSGLDENDKIKVSG
jgi:HlyD family secretion protein